jgi:hydrogenase expression/formation protein HypC
MCLGIPGKVLSVADDELRTGRVDFGGIVKEACLACVPEARAGDYVIVHAGFAISRVDEHEAARVFDYLRQMEELGELGLPRGGRR